MHRGQKIKGLRNDRSIVTKPADKGAAIVILNRSDYQRDGYKQLTDPLFYRHIEEDLIKKPHK